MRQLLDKDQREAVADVVNSAILEASGPPSEQRQVRDVAAGAERSDSSNPGLSNDTQLPMPRGTGRT